MGKHEAIFPAGASKKNKTDAWCSIPILGEEGETYLQYERRVADEATVVPGAAERTALRIHRDTGTVVGNDDQNGYFVTVLTDAHVRRCVDILRRRGFVVVRGLLPTEQTLEWGNAALGDFEDAMERLRRHPVRPVDLMNPAAAMRNGGDDVKHSNGGDSDDEEGAKTTTIRHDDTSRRYVAPSNG